MKKRKIMSDLLEELNESNKSLFMIKSRLDKAIKIKDFEAIRKASRELGEVIK